jgi:hypothetical protein
MTSGTMRVAVGLLVMLGTVSDARAARGRLLVIDRRASKGTARVVYKAPGPTTGLPIGSGPGDIAVGVTVRIDSGSTAFSVPAGSFDGTSGWRSNDARRGAFLNRGAPAGPTGVRTATVRATSGITLSARSLGDGGTALAVTGPPTRAVDVMFTVTASGGTGRRCMHFPAGSCAYRSLDDGTGAKLSCAPGVPDPGCAAFTTPTGAFTCTEILGFSQSLMWHETTEFQQQIDDATWQMRFRSGGDVDLWADPNADAWSAPVRAECLGSGNVVLCTPCAQGSDAPDRVLFTITLQTHESDVQVWTQKIRAAIATIRLKHPQVRQIVLQPVVGGPHHTVCPVPTQQLGVRASYNHPYIDQAIAVVVNDSPDLVAGFSPEVRTCADYSDDVGHLVPAARGPIGLTIGQYYASQP